MLLVGAALFSLLVGSVNLGFSVPANFIWKMVGDYAHVLSVTFGVGMVVAAVPASERMKAFARSWPATVISAVLIAITLLAVPAGYGLFESMMLAVPFAFVCFGNTWFGALSSIPLRALGRVSYSFYLLHVFALQAGYAVLSRHVAIQSLTPLQYWIFVAICGSFAMLISYLSYQFLEYPFLKKTVKLVVENKKLHRINRPIWETPLWF